MVYTRTENVEIARLDNVTLHYDEKHRIFEKVSYTFYKQGFYFLTGVSGAGKSSLLKLLYNGMPPTKGDVYVFGKKLKNINNQQTPLFRQKMGLVFQDCHLLDHLNICDNVLLPLHIQGKCSNSARSQAKELLNWVGLGKHMSQSPSTLSDGQKQRVSLARAVITKPLLLLADEPTGNIDDGSAYKLMGLLQTLNNNGTTVILATHNQNIVRDFSYTECHISNKKIITHGNKNNNDQSGVNYG